MDLGSKIPLQPGYRIYQKSGFFNFLFTELLLLLIIVFYLGPGPIDRRNLHVVRTVEDL